MLNEKVIALELKNLTKIINKRRIVDDISIVAYLGEVFGILGSNGAGKTTIMRMITGLIKPSEGEISIVGEKLLQNYEIAMAHVGAIIETPALYNHLSGYFNLKIMANMFPNVDRERINEVTKIVGLSERINDKVKLYSLGMRQRLGIAIALLNKPRVLILDEPSNGLDPSGIKELRELLRSLAQKENVCVIISSHILSEFEMLCDRFAIIDKGKHVETTDMRRTNNDENIEVKFELLNTTNLTEIENALYSIGIKPKSISMNNFIVYGNRQTISRTIKEVVQMGIEISAVIPNKNTLEEYYMERIEKNV